MNEWQKETKRWWDYLTQIDPKSLTISFLQKICNEITTGPRTKDVVIQLTPPISQEHQIGLDVLLEHQTESDHLAITELQRLDWIDLTIDQAQNNLTFVRTLWKLYLQRLDELFYHYRCPPFSHCENDAKKILSSYIKHLLLGSSAPEAVCAFLSRLLFLGVSLQPYQENNNEFFTLLATYYAHVKLGYKFDFNDSFIYLQRAILERNLKYSHLEPNYNIPWNDLYWEEPHDALLVFAEALEHQHSTNIHNSYSLIQDVL